MLTYDALLALDRSLKDEQVLSVYIAGAPDDLALYRTWRVDLDHALAEQRRRGAQAPAASRAAFDSAVAALEETLRGWTPPPRGRGWVAFITQGGVVHQGALPRSPGTVAAWRRGILAAPHVRALEEERSVLVARVDARTAALHRVHDHAVALVDEWYRDRPSGDAPHLGDAPRMGFHGGTRGRTAHDAHERSQREATAHLVADVAERIAREAARGGWIVLAGNDRVGQMVIDRLPTAVAARTRGGAVLPADAGPSRVLEVAMQGAAALRDAEYCTRLRAIADASNGRGRAVRGDAETTRALENGQVDELFLTPHFVDTHPDASEQAMHAAFDQGARVHVIDGPSAEQLERLGGIAAVLRYPLNGSGGVAAARPALGGAG